MIVMERLVIEKTTSTFGVDFDPHAGLLIIRGESYPENAQKFFAPVLEWLGNYFMGLANGSAVKVDMDIVYFNSSSSKALMNLFDVFDEAAGNGIDVAITWRHHVENEISQECGMELGEELVSASFCMEAYEEAQ